MRQFVWGHLRLLLGMTQLFLVGMSIASLFVLGLDSMTFILVAAATATSIVSRVIYQGKRSPEG